MKQKNMLIAALALCGVMLFADVAWAQRPALRRQKRMHARLHQQTPHYPTIGVYFGHNFSAENNLVGGRLGLPIGRFWKLAPGVEYALVNNAENYSRWQFDGDLVFKPRRAGFFYLGGGPAVEYKTVENTSETNFGGNALVGLEFGRGPMSVFVQSRWTFLAETEFAVMGGLNLVLR